MGAAIKGKTEFIGKLWVFGKTVGSIMLSSGTAKSCLTHTSFALSSHSLISSISVRFTPDILRKLFKYKYSFFNLAYVFGELKSIIAWRLDNGVLLLIPTIT